jgi:hypothetical protein
MIINQADGILARLTITNILWVALLGACWKQGWLQYIFEKDLSFISHGIAIFSIMVVILSLQKGFNLAGKLAHPFQLKKAYADGVVKVGIERRSDIREVLKTELMGYISFIEYFATTALAVGVLGTVIGLILGFQNVDAASLSNVENAGATVAEVLRGLSVAFHTTLVGGIANLWIRTNHFMLTQASTRIYSTALGG